MGKAAKRRAIANKLAADIARLTKEIADRRANMIKARERSEAKPHKSALVAGWFDAWARHTPPIARAVGALEQAKKRLPIAIEKAEEAESRAREAAKLKQKIAVANIGIVRRLDALRADAPAIQKRWTEERREEEKRIKKLKKQLERRTTQDRQAQRPDWWRKPIPLPPPIEQPTAVDDEVDTIEPPREGLIPGTFKIIDPSRLGAGLLDADPLPAVWTWRYVGVRLIEAHAVIRRLPATIWPKGYGAAWPAYKFEAGELAVQAGAGTLAMGRNIIVRTASVDEIARANEAIAWPLQFLHSEIWAAQAVNTWAMDDDADPDTGPEDLLQFMADKLNAAKEPVR